MDRTADDGGVRLNGRYSYDSLTAKPGMNVTEVTEKDYKALGLTRADIVNSAIENARAIGRMNEKNNAVVHINGIGTDVIITPRNLKHGLDRRVNVVGPVTERIGEILQNSIRINELVTRSEEVTGSYVLVGS